MTDGLFNCSAYKVYGKIMVDESYAKVGQMAVLGLKDANLALEAGSIAARAAAERQRLARPAGRRRRPRRRRQGLGGDGAGAGARQRARLTVRPPWTRCGFDLSALDRAFLDDPYPTYRALREHEPVHRMADGSYFLTRYDDLVAVYRDAKTWSSDKTVQFKPEFGDSPLYEHHTTSLVFNDPPIHTRVRKLLAPAFTPRALSALQPRIEALVDRLLDAAAERGTHRPDRGFRRGHPGAADRRHARHPAGRARTAARLVAEDPRRARAGAVAGTAPPGRHRGRPSSRPICAIWWRAGSARASTRQGEILSTLIGATDLAPRPGTAATG